MCLNWSEGFLPRVKQLNLNQNEVDEELAGVTPVTPANTDD